MPSEPTTLSDVTAFLADRAVIEVAGAEARPFLQRLLTNDVEALAPGQARFAALLSPQGKIVADFLAIAGPDSLWLDAPAAVAGELVKRLSLYRLRAKVEVTDRSDRFGVVAGAAAADGVVPRYDDPRDTRLWPRGLVERGNATTSGGGARAAYETVRVEAGVPEGGLDYPFGDTFPHEANLDRLHGIDFRKGCYVGQEVVSRMEHRGTARKRIVPFRFEGAAPPVGSDILAGEHLVGRFGTAAGSLGLGLARLDRLADAAAGGVAVTAAGVVLAALPSQAGA